MQAASFGFSRFLFACGLHDGCEGWLRLRSLFYDYYSRATASAPLAKGVGDAEKFLALSMNASGNVIVTRVGILTGQGGNISSFISGAGAIAHENWFLPGEHKYTHVSPAVCLTGAEGCTQAAIVNVLNTVGAHPNQEKPFVPSQPYTTDADIPGPFGKDPINTFALYDSNGNQIGLTNVTTPDHVLHSGFVERTVININGSFHIQTYGGGTGPLGGPNNWLDGFVWGPVDNNVIKQFQ